MNELESVVSFGKRYGIKRSTLYQRLKKLEENNENIVIKRNIKGKAYLTPEGLKLLEASIKDQPIKSKHKVNGRPMNESMDGLRTSYEHQEETIRDKYIETLEAEVEALNNTLQARDKEINRLINTIEELTAVIEKVARLNSESHQLMAMDKQNKAIKRPTIEENTINDKNIDEEVNIQYRPNKKQRRGILPKLGVAFKVLRGDFD